MADSAQLSSGLEAIFRSTPSDAQLALFQSICDDRGLEAALLEAADSDGASSARTAIKFYQVFYGRQPDEDGLDFWTAQIESGRSLNDIATDFATASEFDERFGNQTPTEQVFAQYRNVLGREPDFEGLTFWTGQVQDGNITLADLGRFFATSPEFDARSDQFVDSFLLNAANGDQDFDQDTSLFDEPLVDAGGDGGGGTPTTGAPIDLGSIEGNAVNGSGSNDLFQAETGDLISATNINGGGGSGDVLAVFNDGVDTSAISPRAQNVETVVWTEQTNDLFSNADNNVGGYGNFDGTVEVDVELDAGRMSGVERWEDYDSRADLVIEDARDDNDVDGTFTGDIDVAMVSTDPGNVDYAIYFDQPVNTSNPLGTLQLRVLDQEAAFGLPAPNANSTGYLTESSLTEFTFNFDGQPITVELADQEGVTYGANVSFQDLLDQVRQATTDALAAAGVTDLDFTASLGSAVSVGVGNQFTLPLLLTFNVPADTISASSDDIIVVGRDSGNNGATPSTDTFGSLTTASVVQEELIRLNVEFDDVGKGSMGGDFLAGAMSTGRQDGDDGTSDSLGIQQFDIEVDRSSQLQTINSTNNSLQVVNIVNGNNDGPNNTTTADDENSGDLVVRGRQIDEVNGFNAVATDNAMPGAVPQHDAFGFNDVRVINAAAMLGSVDLTLDLSDEILEKYLDLDDSSSTGNGDDIRFSYDLGTNDDEFFVNMSSSALADAGTASREDFIFSVDGRAGDDVIVTNVGEAAKSIDGQGQDYYVMNSVNSPFPGGNDWYNNQANNNAATLRVDGGTGNDNIWTHGWGDFRIDAGTGEDIVYTDNSGTVENGAAFLTQIDRNQDEHEQIDYRVGAVWTFNDDTGNEGFVSNISGSTNDAINVALNTNARAAGTAYTTKVTVSFLGASGDANTAYTSTVIIPANVIDFNNGTANGFITEQELNQAIKNAINGQNTDGETVLSTVLEAVDGPGQSLAVYSKIDGDFVAGDLTIEVFEEANNAGTITATGYATPNYVTGAAETDFQNFGAASVAESDNVIIVNADGAQDVTVLSTADTPAAGPLTVGPNLNGASNEVLRFLEGNFGTETIFNFDEGDGTNAWGAEDRFDFLEIDYVAGTGADFTNGVANTNDDSVSIIAESATNDTGGEVADLFDNAATTAPTEHIVIIYDDNIDTTPDDNLFDSADNTGTVYLVEDTVGGDATFRLLGEIDLVGTEWTSLTYDNFL